MHILFPKNNLQKSVNISLRAVPSRTTMSILECILIDARSNEIKFITNDMELGIETIVEGAIYEKGLIAVDARIFSDIIRKLPDNDVDIHTDEHLNMTITCEKAKFTIPGRAGDDFTYLPVLEKSEYITISQFALKEIIRQTIFSIAANENNKLMTGELFEIRNGELRVVSLDGHRISIRKLFLKENNLSKKVIVPGKTLIEISKVLSGETEDMVHIYFTENHIIFDFDQTTMVSRLIEGEYFKIEQMLTNDYETKMTVNKKEFLNCIDRATLLLREAENKPVIMNVKSDEIKMEMNTKIGSMDENIGIQKEGKDLRIAFDPKFLIDVLRVIDEEEVNLYLFNAKAPCFIRDDNSYIYLILPVNLIDN